MLLAALVLTVAAGSLILQAGRNLLDRWRFDARVARAEAARVEADQRAAAARDREAAAIAARGAIEEKLAQAELRVEIAEAALAGARSVTIRVRREYDQNRNRDLSAVSADVIELCAKLAQLGYSCRPAAAPVR